MKIAETLQRGIEARRAHVNSDQFPTQSLPELDDEELRAYSPGRALQVASGYREGNCLEREYSDYAMRAIASGLRSTIGLGDFAMPTAVLTRAIDTSNTGSKGSNLVFTKPGEFITPLRARSIALQLGATLLDDLPIPAAFPRQTTHPAAVWVSDNPGSDVGQSDVTFDQVPVSPHLLTTMTAYTRALMIQSRSSTSIDDVIRMDFAGRVGEALDAAAINGPGTDYPTGILGTSGIGSVALGTNGAVPTYANLVDLEYQVAIDNADIGNLGFASTPAIRKLLRTTPVSATGTEIMTWVGGRMLGQPAAVSNNVPSTLSKGSTSGACHAIIYGNWSDLVVATMGAFTIVADPYSKAGQGVVQVTMQLIADTVLRHPESFAAIQDATLA